MQRLQVTSVARTAGDTIEEKVHHNIPEFTAEGAMVRRGRISQITRTSAVLGTLWGTSSSWPSGHGAGSDLYPPRRNWIGIVETLTLPPPLSNRTADRCLTSSATSWLHTD
jgi:hypothetical protein